jgi:hypothetical protein
VTEGVEVRIELQGADVERLVVVGGDLEYLGALPRDHLPSHTEVRLAAGVLRRLLLDNSGELRRLWRALRLDQRAPLLVEAHDLGAFLDAWPDEWVVHGWSGGAEFQAVASHSGFVLYRVPRDAHEQYGSVDAFLAHHELPRQPEKVHMSLQRWLSGPAAAIQSDQGLYVISREAVLKYVANRKGGVHFDPSRNVSVASLKRRRREAEYHLLDHGLLRVGHLSGPEYEVVSMAQTLSSAELCQEVVRVAREAAPEEFNGDPLELKFWTGTVEADGTRWATSRLLPTGARQDTSLS